MRKMIMLCVACTMFVAQSAYAVSFDTDGRVMVETATYDGPSLGVEDLQVLGAGALMVATLGFADVVSTANLAGIGVTTVIVWGALRTAKHRPDSVKRRVRNALETRRNMPVAGTVGNMR